MKRVFTFYSFVECAGPFSLNHRFSPAMHSAKALTLIGFPSLQQDGCPTCAVRFRETWCTIGTQQTSGITHERARRELSPEISKCHDSRNDPFTPAPAWPQNLHLYTQVAAGVSSSAALREDIKIRDK
jgi:hypothetical protein